jgi:hypothetical protein
MAHELQIVWENNLDGIYHCYVLAQADTYGYLRMEHVDTGERVLDREVPISTYFRDRDVLEWGEICMRFAGIIE